LNIAGSGRPDKIALIFIADTSPEDFAAPISSVRWFQSGVQFNDWIDDIQQHASHRLSDHPFILLKFIVRTNGLYLGEGG